MGCTLDILWGQFLVHPVLRPAWPSMEMMELTRVLMEKPGLWLEVWMENRAYWNYLTETT